MHFLAGFLRKYAPPLSTKNKGLKHPNLKEITCDAQKVAQKVQCVDSTLRNERVSFIACCCTVMHGRSH